MEAEASTPQDDSENLSTWQIFAFFAFCENAAMRLATPVGARRAPACRSKNQYPCIMHGWACIMLNAMTQQVTDMHQT
jgi:hypothetical protein